MRGDKGDKACEETPRRQQELGHPAGGVPEKEGGEK